jgi:hypothetical protein
MSDPSQPGSDDLLASGGGNATASGVSFQAEVGAMFGVPLLSERRLDGRLELGDVRVRSLRFETEALGIKVRALHPDHRIYTFWKYFRNAFARDAGLRIDHLLLSPSLAGRLVAARSKRCTVWWSKLTNTDQPSERRPSAPSDSWPWPRRWSGTRGSQPCRVRPRARDTMWSLIWGTGDRNLLQERARVDLESRLALNHRSRWRSARRSPPVVLGRDVVAGSFQIVYRATKDAIPSGAA